MLDPNSQPGSGRAAWEGLIVSHQRGDLGAQNAPWPGQQSWIRGAPPGAPCWQQMAAWWGLHGSLGGHLGAWARAKLQLGGSSRMSLTALAGEVGRGHQEWLGWLWGLLPTQLPVLGVSAAA